MTQLSDDCFALTEGLISLDEALARLDTLVTTVVEREPLNLSQATTRILAEDIVSPINVPPHDNSAVDGYAFRFADLTPDHETALPIAGRVAAGRSFDRPLPPGAAVQIFTGAAMPTGADTVVMLEDAKCEDLQVVVPWGLKPGSNRRRAGEDILAGRVILKTGRRLQPADLGLAASVGRATIQVFRPLKVALVSTGDEIREPGTALEPGTIYDANRFMITGLLGRLGAEITDLGILPDRKDVIQRSLQQTAKTHDLIISSGGVSVGEEDHVKAAIQEIGQLHFWRLAIKPGRPVALGQIGLTPVVGLPGNPVAALVTFVRLVRPLILKLSGADFTPPKTYPVEAAFSHKKKPGRREWLRAHLVREPNGHLTAHKFERDGAGILTSVVESDGLVEIPEDLVTIEAGTMVDFLPFGEVDA